ncbi:MAG: hypothetical protein D6725_07080 [Planctomycetota bacterium]|nr:MAG: hypothetical protein D6725_07080 [Planctomycetota bacterium]
MNPGIKRMLLASGAVAALVGIAAIVDIVAGIPFRGMVVMDVMFLVGAALVGFMVYDAYRDLAR